MHSSNPPSLLTEIPKSRVLCFTGHRPDGLPSGKTLRILTETLHFYINIAIASGYTHFMTGLADGVDHLAAEYIIELRNRYPTLRIIGVQPCEDYMAFYRRKGYSIPKLEYVLANIDECVVLPFSYESDGGKVFLERNRYMVEHSAALIAVCGDGRSGSMQTFRYAESKGLAYCRICLDEQDSLPYGTSRTPETWPTERSGF